MGRGIGAALAVTLAIGGGCFAADPAAAASPADWMYEPRTFTEIRLTLPPSSYERLENAEYDEYVEGTFELAETNGVPGSAGPFSDPLTVGVKLKGSFARRSINQKAALKISFGKFVKGQAFDGLEKMTLNNMVQDPTMTHEVLAYQAFHDMGVYAPHTGFAYLWVNGKSYGLHLNLESQDKVALEKQFGPFSSPPQHLYEGEDAADVSSEPWNGTGEEKWEKLEVDEGKKSEKGDLEALLGAVEGSTGGFSDRVASHADLSEMTRMWMTEKFIGHWDGYSGPPPSEHQPNNYYLYSDADGRFQMLPWGTDQTWKEHLDFEAPGGVLFADCLGDTRCLSLYRTAGAEALANLDALELGTSARCTAAAVAPWRGYEEAESEAQKLPPYDLQETAEWSAAARRFIAERPAELARYLGVAAPSPPAEEPPCPPLRPIGGFPKPLTDQPPPGPPASPVAAPSPAGALLLGRRSAHARGVTIELDAPLAGTVSLRGTFGGAGRRRLGCRGRATIADGPTRVSCGFTGAYRRRLERHAAWLRVLATLTPQNGPAQRAATALRLAKR